MQKKAVEFWIAIASVIISFAAVIFTGLQWKDARVASEAAQHSAATADKALEIGERVYVGVYATYQERRLSKSDKYNSPFVIAYYIRAFGQTPASAVKVYSGCTALSHIEFVNTGGLEAPETFVKDVDEIAGTNVLMPGAEPLKYTCPVPLVARLRQENDIPEIVLRGRVEYRDIFGKAHHTNFCFYQSLESELMGHCDKDNDSD